LAERRDGSFDFAGNICGGFGEFGAEPGEEIDEVVEDEDLAVAVGTGTDADGGDVEGGGDDLGDFGHDAFEDDADGSGIFEDPGVVDQFLCFFVGLPFFAVFAFDEDLLGEHADMADEREPGAGDGAHLIFEIGAPLEFHGMRAGFDEAAGVFDGLFRGDVGFERQIGADRGLLGTADDGFEMMQHMLHRDMGGVGEAEFDHANRVADKDQVDARFLEQFGGRIIVGGENHEFTALGFCSAPTGEPGLQNSGEIIGHPSLLDEGRKV